MSIEYVGPARRDIDVKAPNFRRRRISTLPRDILPILAFDPGGTTGWSLLVLPKLIRGKDVFSWNLETILRSKVSWEHGELNGLHNEDEAVYQMATLASKNPSAAIVVEDFILRYDRKEKSRDLLSPVRVTAKLETYLWRQHRPMFKQQASQAKPVVTDERLALWGCKVQDGLNDHARDADRHALLFMRRCIGTKGVALKHAAWPHIYADQGEEVMV